ncbi:MAG: threonine synthase [Gammaproteobacteria bacterium]|nr:threonine synthase [Gammaproteobacteria bacterium]
MSEYNGIIERYRERLPIGAGTRIVSLCEGGTPLLRLHHIPALLGKDIALYVKYEGLNPTGSFKDRGMTMAVTKAVEEGSRAILCASTGNTSASAAAYAARAGIRAFVLIPEGKIALGKLAQAVLHGALVMQIQGNFDVGMRLVKDVAVRLPVTLVNSVNPYRLEGQKTAAFEVIEALGRAPDFHCLPVGNAGNITAYWMGYREYHRHGLVEGLPRMCGFQASGAAPFVRGHPIDHPETVATAIRIGHPQSWDLALRAQAESGGWFDELSDPEILAAQRLLAEQEGIFCEPASAASLAGAMRDVQRGKIPEGSLVVCTLTGHGLKDPDIAIAQSSAPPLKIEARLAEVERVIAGEIGS